MAEIVSCDRYRVSALSPLGALAHSVLSQLYQPLIGAKAFGLYLFLFSEMDVLKLLSVESNLSRISSYTELSLAQIQTSLNRLEGIGLLKTYVQYDETFTKYIYQLILPLDPHLFFNNELLNVLLYRTIGSLEYEKTRYLFNTPSIDFSQYDEVTKAFGDVYYIEDTSSEGSLVLQSRNGLKKEKSMSPIIDYSLELFYKELQQLQVRRKIISPMVETKVKQLGLAYHISGQQMAQLLSDAVENGQVNMEKFSKKARDYHDLETNHEFKRIYHQQPLQYSAQPSADNHKTKHIKQLETWSPYKLIERKQGGKPIRRDLAIVEKLMVDLNLEPGVVNVLLELSWSQNDERLSRNFVESIGATWKRKGITTVVEAMNEAKNYIKYKNGPNDDITPEWLRDRQAEDKLDHIKSNDVNDEISDEELRELLKNV